MLIHSECIPLTGSLPCTFTFNDEKISMSFFKVFTSLMKNYRSFFRPEEVAPDQDDGGDLASFGFKKDDFILDFESEIRVIVANLAIYKRIG